MNVFRAVSARTGRQKKFSAVNMNTIYSQYYTYCRVKGCGIMLRVPHSQSFGGVAWTDGHDIINLVQTEE